MGLFPHYCVERGRGEAKMALFARFGMFPPIADALPARIRASDGERQQDGAGRPRMGLFLLYCTKTLPNRFELGFVCSFWHVLCASTIIDPPHHEGFVCVPLPG